MLENTEHPQRISQSDKLKWKMSQNIYHVHFVVYKDVEAQQTCV